MLKPNTAAVDDVRERLIEVAGRTTQDLGVGRIPGQIMAYVYLTEKECSLDEIGDGLGLSKAAVSIGARQLEGLGLIQRVWKKGDRKNYYRTVDNFGVALRQGLLSMVENKIRVVGSELDRAEELLKAAVKTDKRNGELGFLKNRLDRARTLRARVEGILNSPILRLLGR